MLVTSATTSRLASMPPSRNTVMRAQTGSGASRMASVSDWNCLMAAWADSSRDKGRVPHGRFALDGLSQVGVLLVPKPAIDVAAVEEFLMPPQIGDLAALEHQDRIRRHQRAEPV